MRQRIVSAALAAWLAAACALAAEPVAGLRAPPGFEVSLFADDNLVHDVYSMTVDSRGRVVAAGRDYVKVLHDDDGDGRADRAELFSRLPASGAHGMLFDGNDLICTGDNGVWRLRDANADGMVDGPGELWTNLRHPEHGANGVARGPDGWIYVVCGNDAGVAAEHARTPGSPVKEPRCGAVVRFSRDGKTSEVYAHGFRNPYDIDFHPLGNLFAVDADGERDHHLPWYAPTRLFDVAQGLEHGWLLSGWQRSWNRPERFFDNVERLVEIGRGSPTGLTVYRHVRFPRQYHGSVLTACWTLGRVYAIGLTPHEASFRGRTEIFLETTGDVGFAPVDLAVAPDGDLYVAVGGRGTRGGVFRVRYTGSDSPARDVAAPKTPLDRVLAAPQPLAAWSRAQWLPLATSLGAEPFVRALADASLPTERRVRAVEVLCDVFDGVPLPAARDALAQAPPTVKARLAWSLGRRPHGSGGGADLLGELTGDAHPAVQRAAWEALAARPELPLAASDKAHWLDAADSPHRRVRAAMLAAARGSGRLAYRQQASRLKGRASARQTLAGLWLEAMTGDAATETPFLQDAFLESCLRQFEHGSDREKKPPEEKLEAVRLLQLALGDLKTVPGSLEVHSGYLGNASNDRREVLRRRAQPLIDAFPTGARDLDLELARLLGMLGADDPALCDRIARQWTADSAPQDDVHYLIVLSLLPGARSSDATAGTAAALATLHAKLAARGELPDRNWPLRVGETFGELCRLDPALPHALVGDERFGRVEHALFASLLRGDARLAAARRLLDRLQAAGEEAPWSSEAVAVIGRLPAEEMLPVLRGKWDDFALRDAIAVALAAQPREEDRARLLEALDSAQADVIVRVADGLAGLPAPGDPADLAPVFRVLGAYCQAPPQRPVRRALAALLEHWTGQTMKIADEEGADLARSYRPWFRWLETAHPEVSSALQAGGAQDAQAWLARLDEVEWESGDLARGKLVFEKRACHRCHAGGGRLGPSLRGAAGRFSRRDLFAAIVDPNRDVSPLYQTTTIVTAQGQVHTGLLVYDSADGSLLQTAPDVTVRILGPDQKTVVPSRQSLMPTGLLKDATPQDLADLHRYLQSIQAD